MQSEAPPVGSIAVIFVSQRRGDDSGYAAAAAAMEALAAKQPGYRGFVSARGEDGLGIAVSYWQDEQSAQDWRNQVDHRQVRDQGRALWYDHFSVSVAQISRSYTWQREAT